MSNIVDFAKFEELLLPQQEQVLGLAGLVEDSAKPVTLDQNSVGRLSRMDAMQGQAMAQANVERQQQQLINIDRALQRVDSGDYGKCIECDECIALPRLEIDLTADYCITCAQALEQS